jgi:hypothetical protein
MAAVADSSGQSDTPNSTCAYGRPLLQVAREIGKHLATMHRWRSRGVLDAHGVRRRLPMTRVGGRWYVRDADLCEFFAILAAELSVPALPPDRHPARPSSADLAARELDAIGL